MGRPRKNSTEQNDFDKLMSAEEPDGIKTTENGDIDYDAELKDLADEMDRIDRADPIVPNSPQLPTQKSASLKPDSQKKGENMLRIMMAIEQSEMPEIDTDSFREVWNRVKEYLKVCCKYDTRPSLPGLALSLGVTREVLMGWLDGSIRKPREVRRVLEKAVMILNVVLEDNLQNNKINTVSGIYLSKANFGYSDVVQKKEEKRQPLGERLSDEELYLRFENLAEIEDNR